MFPLRSEAPINFEFQLTFVQPNSAFSVEPSSGMNTFCVCQTCYNYSRAVFTFLRGVPKTTQ